MGSIEADNTNAPVVQDILKCFQVDGADDYQAKTDK